MSSRAELGSWLRLAVHARRGEWDAATGAVTDGANLEKALPARVICNLFAGRPEKAERELNAAGSLDGAERALLRSLLLASAGKVDEALTEVRPLVSSGDRSSELNRLLTHLLCHRANQHVDDGELGNALKLIQQAQSAASSRDERTWVEEAIAHFAAVARKEARWDELEKLWMGELGPSTASQTLHSLASLCLRSAFQHETSRGGKAADQRWRQAAQLWAAVLVDDDYWEGWALWRSGVYGRPVPEDAGRQASKALLSRLRGFFHDLRSDYGKKDSKNERRMAEIEAFFMAELLTARAVALVLRDATSLGIDSDTLRPYGLNLLRQVGLEKNAWKLVEDLRGSGKGTESAGMLEAHLLGLGRVAALTEARLHEEALAERQRFVKQKKLGEAAIKEAKRIFRRARTQLAGELRTKELYEKALSVFEEGRKQGEWDDQMGRLVEEMVHEWVTPLIGSEKSNKLVKVLERARSLVPKSQVVNTDLGAAYYFYGQARGGSGDWTAGIEALQRANDLVREIPRTMPPPCGCPIIKNQLGIFHSNRAGQRIQNQDGRGAANDLRAAANYEPHDPEIALALNQLRSMGY